jgi:tetratricopeptide (TPR) repeat protein
MRIRSFLLVFFIPVVFILSFDAFRAGWTRNQVAVDVLHEVSPRMKLALAERMYLLFEIISTCSTTQGNESGPGKALPPEHCTKILFAEHASQNLKNFRTGAAYLERGENETAVRVFSDIENLDIFFSNLGTIQIKDGDTGEGLGFVDLANSISERFHPAKFPTYQSLCILLRDQNQANEALKYCLWALEVLPNSDQQLLLGRAYFQLGQFDEAFQAFEEAYLQQRSGAVLTWMGQTALEQQRAEDALHYYQEAITSFPEYGWSYIYLGDLYLKEQEFDLAEHYYQLGAAFDDPIGQIAVQKLSLMAP